MKENLPADAKALANRYDEAETEQDGIMMVAMYRQFFGWGAFGEDVWQVVMVC